MPTLEERISSLETADSVTRRQLTELTALMGTSFLNVHHEFDRLYEQNSAIRAEQQVTKSDISHVKDDVSAILKILNDQYRKS